MKKCRGSGTRSDHLTLPGDPWGPCCPATPSPPWSPNPPDGTASPSTRSRPAKGLWDNASHQLTLIFLGTDRTSLLEEKTPPLLQFLPGFLLLPVKRVEGARGRHFLSPLVRLTPPPPDRCSHPGWSQVPSQPASPVPRGLGLRSASPSHPLAGSAGVPGLALTLESG